MYGNKWGQSGQHLGSRAWGLLYDTRDEGAEGEADFALLRSAKPLPLPGLASGSWQSLVAGRGRGRWALGAERTRAAGPRRAKHHTASRSPLAHPGTRARPSPSSEETTSPLARAAPPPPLLRWLQPHQPMDSLGCFSGAAFCGLQLCSTPPSTCPALPKTAKLQPVPPVFQPHAASNPVV